jgi:hypothetical protein
VNTQGFVQRHQAKLSDLGSVVRDCQSLWLG